MGTDKLLFEGERCRGATGSHVTGSDVTGSDMTGSDVSHVTGSDHVRKYILHMRNRKLPHIRLSRGFWPEVTVTWLEEALSGSGPDRKWVLRMPGFFPRFFLSSRTRCDQRSLDPLRSSLEYAQPEVVQHPQWPKVTSSLGSVLWVFSTTYASYNPRKPCVLYLVTGTSPGYLSLLFSYSV
jgi:hypothetical protein